MRMPVLIGVTLSMFCGSMALTALQSLRTIRADEFVANTSWSRAVISGRVDQLLFAERTWKTYPAMPPLRYFPGIFVEWSALATVLLSVGIAFLLGQRKRECSRILLTAAPWIGAAILCATGMSTLARNAIAEQSGPWLAAMLLSVVYAAIATVVITSYTGSRYSFGVK